MSAQVMTLEGDVVAVHSYWTDDGSRIETDATIQTPSGQQVVVNQLGGTVDGIGMIQMPGERILELGMHVAVAAHMGLDLSRREHVVLDSAKVVDEAPAFVRTGPTKGGHFLYWESACAFVTVDAAGTAAVPAAQTDAVIQAAIDEWNTRTASCSYFKIMNAGKRSLEVGRDAINLIKFRDTPCTCDDGTTSWSCRPATSTSAAKCNPAAAAAITTAIYLDDANSPRDGAIIDADIELNGVDFDISVNGVTSGQPGRCLADLQNTLTHELGHLLGLEHPCLAPRDPQRVDDQGNPVPTCTAVQAAPTLPASMRILDATMYNYQSCGETKKSTLADDDINGICAIYPTAKAPGTCEPAGGSSGGDRGDDAGNDSSSNNSGNGGHSGGCCRASRGGDRPAGAVLLAGAVALLVRRRRSPARSAKQRLARDA